MIILILTITFLFLVSNILIGTFVDDKSSFIYRAFIGYSLFIGLFSLISNYLIQLNVSSKLFFGIILSYILLISLVGIINFRKVLNIKIKVEIIIIILVYFAFSLFLSIRYSLGEQMGDIVYLINIIQKPLISNSLNNYSISTGLISNEIVLSGTKESISYYFLFSTISLITQNIVDFFNLDYIPPYVITTWFANVIFYFFSSGLMISIVDKYNLGKMKYFVIFWLGIYIGSIYYNITLPFIVVTMAILNLGYLIFELSEYFNQFSFGSLIRVIILVFALSAYGSTGAMYMALSSFGIVFITLLKKNKQAFLQVPIFLVPILLFIYTQDMFSITLIELLFFYLTLSILCIFIFYNKGLKKIIYKITPYISLFIFIIIIFYSFYRYSPNYLLNMKLFFVPQGLFDRTQDYFSLTTFNLILQNIPHYILILSLFFYRRTRIIGFYILIISIFFINPFVREFAIEFVSRIDVYNRIFFLIFNSGTIGLGIVALYHLKYKDVNIGKYILVIISLMMVPQTYAQITSYVYPTYQPQTSHYNPLYKMKNSEIEILEKMRQIVVIEKMENPLIVSQIWGTAMYAPEFVVLGYNVNQQRSGPVEIGEELYKIFYTPAVPGDFGPKLTRTDLIQSCSLLMDRKIDFVIYDKSSQLYDDVIGDYMTTDWYIRDCADKVIENDQFSLYRFYWR